MEDEEHPCFNGMLRERKALEYMRAKVELHTWMPYLVPWTSVFNIPFLSPIMEASWKFNRHGIDRFRPDDYEYRFYPPLLRMTVDGPVKSEGQFFEWLMNFGRHAVDADYNCQDERDCFLHYKPMKNGGEIMGKGFINVDGIVTGKQ